MDVLLDIFLYVLQKVHKNKNMKKNTDEQSLLFEATILLLQESEIYLSRRASNPPTHRQRILDFKLYMSDYQE